MCQKNVHLIDFRFETQIVSDLSRDVVLTVSGLHVRDNCPSVRHPCNFSGHIFKQYYVCSTKFEYYCFNYFPMLQSANSPWDSYASCLFKLSIPSYYNPAFLQAFLYKTDIILVQDLDIFISEYQAQGSINLGFPRLSLTQDLLTFFLNMTVVP